MAAGSTRGLFSIGRPELEIVKVLQQVASPALDQLMLWITGLGSERAYVALLLIA